MARPKRHLQNHQHHTNHKPSHHSRNTQFPNHLPHENQYEPYEESIPIQSRIPSTATTSTIFRPQTCRWFIILVLALRFEWPDQTGNDLTGWLQLCRTHHDWCPICFEEGMSGFSCLALANRVYVDNSYFGSLTAIFTKARGMQYATYQNRSAVIKNTMNEFHVKSMRNLVCQLTEESDIDCDTIWKLPSQEKDLTAMLTARYMAYDGAGNVKVLPLGAVRKFVQEFGSVYSSTVRSAMQMNSNPEPMLLRRLYEKGFPVPEVLLECGYVMVQSYDGLPLHRFYGTSFTNRMALAKQILEAALLFTNGLDGFRFYLTDVTSDNIVVNAATNQVSFVDLDGLVIVYAGLNPYDNSTTENARKAAEWEQVHRAEVIPCDNCFAYSEIELENHFNSDHNVYAVCSLFLHDLAGNPSKGLLHSIPQTVHLHVKQFKSLLHKCVNCQGTCTNRFEVALKLLFTFDGILRSL